MHFALGSATRYVCQAFRIDKLKWMVRGTRKYTTSLYSSILSGVVFGSGDIIVFGPFYQVAANIYLV